MTSTTLTVAISNTPFPTTQIALASVTGMTTDMLILIDGEYFKPTRINTTALIVDVMRGQNGTAAKTHGSGSAVQFGTPDEFTAGILNVVKFTRVVPTAQVTTAGAVTYTPGQIISMRINRDPNGGARSDVMPTAALLVAALPGVQINDSFTFELVNQADASEVITLTVGTGGTVGLNSPAGADTMTLAQNTKKRFRVRFTGVLPGSEAFTITDESGAITY